ncbi:MAG: redoxin domain-containing protein, partial [Planctomycetes bacterium]|nr:redoxin domain-containing protein [Planctomycetota bacterium]
MMRRFREGAAQRQLIPAGTGFRVVMPTRFSVSVFLGVLVAAALLPGVTVQAKPDPSKRDVSTTIQGDVPPTAEAANPTAGSEAGSGPKIVAPEPTRDFGTTWIGPILKHAFIIKNEGNAPLEITKVRPACGCTVAGNYPRTIDPGKSGEFPFELNSNKLRGRYEKAITVTSNDPQTPSLKLSLQGECKRYVDVLPTSANFGKVTDNESRVRTLKITNNTEKPLNLSLTNSEDERFEFDLVEKEKGQTYELNVTMNPPYAPGTWRGNTVLLTGVEQQKEITIGASARIPERIELQPPSITLNPNSIEGGYSRPIRFFNYGSTDVKVLEATTDDPEHIQLALSERYPGRSYTINVGIPAGYTPPAKGHTISIKTDDPEQPLLTVPVRALVRPEEPAAADEDQPRKMRPAEELVGQPAPSFSATTTDGSRFTNADLQGKVTVLDFFSKNCGHCGKQIPRVEEIRKQYTDKGVRFVAVSQSMGSKKATDEEIKAKINELGFQGELVIDHENTIGPLFRATGFPTMAIVGRTGNIEAVNVGNSGDLDTKMKTQLDALLAGKAVPQVAEAAPSPPKEQKPETSKRPAEELVGQIAPTFEITTTAGKRVSNEDLTGTVTVLDFVSSRCPHCVRQLPRLEQIRREYQSKGVRFVAVGSGQTDDEVKDKIKESGFQGELAIDNNRSVGPQFKVQGVPSMAIIGKTGKVEAVNVGNASDLESRVKGQLDALLAGKSVPQVAKADAADQPKPERRSRPAEELVGQKAPKFEVTTTGGKKLSNDTAGTVTVLDFFSKNCGHCGKQIPRVEEIRKQYADKGVRFVAVSQSMGSQKATDEEINAKIDSLGFKGELVIDEGNSVGPLFKATGFPTMVILGKSGNVEAVNVGNVGDLETRMTTQLDALLAGKSIPGETPAEKPTAETVRAEPVKEKAPEQRARPAEEMVGQQAPAFEITTTDGKKVSNDVAGTVTVLDFVSSRCGHCSKQLPRLEEIRKEYQAKGVRFVAIGQGQTEQE